MNTLLTSALNLYQQTQDSERERKIAKFMRKFASFDSIDSIDSIDVLVLEGVPKREVLPAQMFHSNNLFKWAL